jgi:hypothetical protein
MPTDHDDYRSGECAGCGNTIWEGQFYQDDAGQRYHLQCQPGTTPPPVEITVEQLMGMAFPAPIKCANHCDHGCEIPLQPGDNWVKVALAEGWTVMRWTTDHNSIDPGHNDHVMAFCDPGCAYTHMRARMLIDDHWRPLLSRMDWDAMAKGDEILEAREQHTHEHGH